MEGSLDGTLQDTQKVASLSEEDKGVVVETAADEDGVRSFSETTPDGDIAVTDEEAIQNEEKKELIESSKVEERIYVFESVADDSFEPGATKDAQVDTVELELKDKEWKDFVSDVAVADDGVKEAKLLPSEDNKEISSVSGNEGLRETEVVETSIKDMAVVEEKNVLSSVVTYRFNREGEEPIEIYGNSSLTPIDVTSKETMEISIPKSDESEKVPPTIIEKSLESSMVDKVGEPSNESAKESFQVQPMPNVHAEGTIATVQAKTEVVPRSTENGTSWMSCCGLFDIMTGGGR
ncbi:uncharacterized protein LOC113874556 [Abrus precatorius]|uniref:Uncharacterized protein LOC113874556 n=1 Tax=Abrus precatorius TaxID=3816 RepID=A0A8B8MKZ4_ABRPR|nr:uncharacterized protein LOC113874556 [Abrus precatorius]